MRTVRYSGLRVHQDGGKSVKKIWVIGKSNVEGYAYHLEAVLDTDRYLDGRDCRQVN